MASDAYATGEALFALCSAGRMEASDPVFRTGVDYLMSTQAGDGVVACQITIHLVTAIPGKWKADSL